MSTILGSARGRWLLGLFILALVVAVAVPLVLMGRMTMGGPAPATADQLATAAPGESLDLAVQLTGAPANGLASGAVLEQLSSGTYRRTERVIQMRYSADTPVLMGRTGDVQDGAVLQVRGQLMSTQELAVERIVVLTGAVRVQ